MQRFSVAAPAFCDYDVRAACGGAVGAWLARMEARPSCSVASPDAGQLLAAYRAHRSLDFFDYCSYSTFQLFSEEAVLAYA
jgi:hypothetical protein